MKNLLCLFFYLFTIGVSASENSVPEIYKSFSLLGESASTLRNHGNLFFWPEVKTLYQNDWIRLLFQPPELIMITNSDLPVGYNWGNLWVGKGQNSLFRAGMGLETWGLSLGLYPEMSYSTNDSFLLIPVPYSAESPFTDPNNRIDVNQRPGDNDVFTMAWGQSFLRYRWGAFSAGLSRESLWLGPGRDGALLLSANAPGFPHIDIGFSGLDSPVGQWESRLFYGVLSRSEFFNPVGNVGVVFSDERQLSGLVLGYSPNFLPGLTLGFNREFMGYYYDQVSPGFMILPISQVLLKEGLGGEDIYNQVLSVSLEYRLPEVGASVWVEFGRNDHSYSIRDLLGAPDHSGAWLFGLSQAFPLSPEEELELVVEMTELGRGHTWQIRSDSSWYLHHQIQEGWTNEGKILGHWIGPGSNSQFVQLRYKGRGNLLVGGYFRRVGFDLDTFYRRLGPYKDSRGVYQYDTRLYSGIEGSMSLAGFRLGVNLEYLWNMNYYYQNGSLETGLTGGDRDIGNIHLLFSAAYEF